VERVARHFTELAAVRHRSTAFIDFISRTRTFLEYFSLFVEGTLEGFKGFFVSILLWMRVDQEGVKMSADQDLV
jgi:hypothetical protein